MPDDSNLERQRLADLYAAMADSELQLLRRDFASLSPEAKEVVEAEFRRRDLIADVDLSEPDPGQDELEWNDLVMLRQLRDLPEALLAKGSLESAGIETFLVDDNIVRMDWFISNLVGGIKLCVRQEDDEAALEVLDQKTPATMDVEGVGSFVQPVCPSCRSLDISFEALNRPVAYGSAWLAVPIPLKRKRWKCNACGQVWKDVDNTATPADEPIPPTV